MLVEGDRVAFRGPTLADPRPSDVVDLQGKTLYPAFVDNHCHILPTGLDLQKLHLGFATSHGEIVDAVRDRMDSIDERGWLHAVHYDQTKYGGVHLTRVDLDAISSTTPILLRHVNGHASIANSAALRAADIGDREPDPAGGSYGRFEDGTLNGVLFESAHELVSHRAPTPSVEEMTEAILLAGDRMAELGISCASDMMTGRFNLLQELDAYRMAEERGCRIQTRLYLQWGEVFRKDGTWRSPDMAEALQCVKPRISGIKIFADGAIGSATAAIYGQYSGASTSGSALSRHAKEAGDHTEREVSGQLIYSPDRLNEMVRMADAAGYQVAIHTIGDYSTDLVLDAFERLDDPSRHRIEHAMLLDDAQIDRMARLGCYCSMQPEFLMRFGHSYRRQLGEERTRMLKRFRSVKDAGIPLSFSSDRPIVAGDPIDGIRIAVNRPDGFDPSENLTVEEAIDAYTVAGARVTGDEGELGSLETGQLARFHTREI